MMTRHPHRFLCLLLLVTLLLNACAAPDNIALDLKLDTGRELLNLMQESMAYLHEAERIAGEESRDTIELAITRLAGYTDQAVSLIGNQLDQRISQFDRAVQEKLYFFQFFAEQVRDHALKIIQATGDELRSVARESTDGMRRVINTAENAMVRTTLLFVQGTVYVVDVLADRILLLGGLLLGVLLTFVSSRYWGGRLMQRKLPGEWGRRFAMVAFLVLNSLISLDYTSLFSC